MRNLTLLFLTLPVLFLPLPTQAQWQKSIIDSRINLAVSVDAVDMVGDTKLDLLVTNFSGYELLLYENNFPEWKRHTIDHAGATFAYSGDVDGDDDKDAIACVLRPGSRRLVWYENSHPTWTEHIIDASTDCDFTIVADFNNDGRPDVIPAPDITLEAAKPVWLENDHPNWTKHVIESGSTGYASVDVSDLDGDGFLDVVATIVPAGKVVWLRNEGNGIDWTEYTIDSALVAAWGISTGDLDGDGAIDVVATSGGSFYTGVVGGDVVWYENDHPTWTKHVIRDDFVEPGWAIPTDVDGDDKLDLVITNWKSNAMLWLENNHPIWPKHTIDNSLYQPRLFAVADVDEDGISDIVAASQRRVVLYQQPKIPAPLDPAREAKGVSTSPVFTWTPLVSAPMYQLQVATDSLMTSLVVNDSALVEPSDSIRITLEHETTYYWRIRARDAGGDGPWSEVWSFVTEVATPAAVVLGAPNDGATGVPANATLSWEYVENATAYHLQIASDSGFAIAVTDESRLAVTSLTLESPLAYNTTFHWHVRAGRDDGLDTTRRLLYGPWSETRSFTTAIGTATENESDLPTEFALHPAYPNPFNPSTSIRFDLPEATMVRLTVFDALGRPNESLVSGHLVAGSYTVTWEADQTPSGVYFVRMEAGPITQTRAILLSK